MRRAIELPVTRNVYLCLFKNIMNNVLVIISKHVFQPNILIFKI